MANKTAIIFIRLSVLDFFWHYYHKPLHVQDPTPTNYQQIVPTLFY